MHVLLVSPYHGGSHKAWATGYQQHSELEIELLTLPARFWKWRMHGGAVTLARRYREGIQSKGAHHPQAILATDMLDLTTFLALTARHLPPIPSILYMHENQLTYPLPREAHKGPMRRQHGERDLHYVFINFASMLVADVIAFNSDYHRTTLLEALPRFLKRFPEYNELSALASLREKVQVLPVGLDVQLLERYRPLADQRENAPGQAEPSPLILWNQRWEYDKNPAPFFQALYQLARDGIPFRLALCGEQFGRAPQEFEEAQERLERHIVHCGYADRDTYHHLLWSANVVVSTARHEFFGISILEAIYCQTFPVLPARLSYPELIPRDAHHLCLYEDYEGMLVRLRWALQNPVEAASHARRLALTIERLAWQRVAPRYDALLRDAVVNAQQVRGSTDQ